MPSLVPSITPASLSEGSEAFINDSLHWSLIIDGKATGLQFWFVPVFGTLVVMEHEISVDFSPGIEACMYPPGAAIDEAKCLDLTEDEIVVVEDEKQLFIPWSAFGVDHGHND